MALGTCRFVTYFLFGFEQVMRRNRRAVPDSKLFVVQALLAGLFPGACRFRITEYDRLKANDPGTHIYQPVQQIQTADVKLRIDGSSVLFGCRPEWVVFVECQQVVSGLWQMSDIMATDASSLQSVAPHFFERSIR
jgi:hypothetical protein